MWECFPSCIFPRRLLLVFLWMFQQELSPLESPLFLKWLRLEPKFLGEQGGGEGLGRERKGCLLFSALGRRWVGNFKPILGTIGERKTPSFRGVFFHRFLFPYLFSRRIREGIGLETMKQGTHSNAFDSGGLGSSRSVKVRPSEIGSTHSVPPLPPREAWGQSSIW